MLRNVVAAGLAAIAVSAEDHWAVLVAGSNGFDNYRHQADVCHAYHVLLSRGFHPDKIITMMYDDVAYSEENPFPGKLFNYPWKTMAEAVDVYDGCKVDYTEGDVNPAKFVAVLTGNADAAGGRVLQSKSDDHVFVNFVDHGNTGLIGFPDEVMHAKQLVNTLKQMHQKGMYKQLTFYLEACDSGSMFQNLLPKDLPIFATTAANARESSWGTYCTDSEVGGTDIGSCLGDLYSVTWMEDSDKTKGSKETLKEQFQRVHSKVTKSHVMHFGQFAQMGSEDIDDFQGPEDKAQAKVLGLAAEDEEDVELKHRSAVDSRDARLHYLYRAYLRTRSAEASERLTSELKARRAAKELDAKFETSLGSASQVAEISWTEELLDCHEQATTAFGKTCGWSEAHLRVSRTLYKLCHHEAGDGKAVVRVVETNCAKDPVIVV